MKNFCFMIGAAAIAFNFAVASHPASAADDQATPTTTKQSTAQQVTTKKVVHPKRHGVKVVRPQSPYSRLEPYRSSGFVGEYPGDCAAQRANGQCMIDLGYGRCVSCSVGGGGGFR
jgi:hypothetical protein